MDSNHYDVIIIGTGAGGSSLAYSLANTGKKVLILERGTFLPRGKENWDALQVFRHKRYYTREIWYDRSGKELNPLTSYWVGGNTKIYGGALFRLREKDFETVIHKEGISPEWPLKYKDFEHYYNQAEILYEVHGKCGLDPTEPPTSKEYPFPYVKHEPRIQEIHNALQTKGLHPFYLPLGVKLNEVQRHLSACIRCGTCDGFPCAFNAKSDAEVSCLQPAIKYENITLITEAKVLRLHTSASGREVTGVETEIIGKSHIFSANFVVVACGAINSAVLLLRSANDKHPNGLANSSNQVGRNLMKHNNGVIVGLTTKLNSTIFQKTMAINDFYWGDKDFNFPMGNVQSLGKVSKDILSNIAFNFAPSLVLEEVAKRSVEWWLISEDLPDSNNRVHVNKGKIYLEYTENNTEAFTRLMHRWIEVMKSVDNDKQIIPISLYLRKKIALSGIGHQCGTCRFGEDPKTSVLNINCRTHEIHNLYVVDGSFFPSSAAVNPTLTIIANALRVGDHLRHCL